MIMFVVIIVLLCICVSQSNKIDELKKSINKIQKENEDLGKTQNGEKIEQNNIIIENKQNIQMTKNEQKSSIINNENKKQIISESSKNETKQTIKPSPKNKVINEQERKNTTILATGATFIILAAIVLLTSTWHVMPNIIKTSILLLIAVVFFALSSYAKGKKLNKASKAFYYIAMAYIPIFCISISAFGFLGNYLSINGEGKYIYFTIAGIFNSILYYIEYKRKNMPELFFGSILIQALTVVMFSCIFEAKIQNIVFCTLLYNIEFILLTKNNKFIKDNKYIYNVLPYFGLICCAFFIFSIKSFIVLCDLLFVAINFLVLYFKNKKIYNFTIFNTVINIIGFYFAWNITTSLTLAFKTILAILYFSVVNGCIIEVNKNKAIKYTSIIQLLICMQIAFFNNLLSNINMFVITLIQLLISMYSYTRLKENKRLSLFVNVLTFLYIISSQILLAFVLKIFNYQWFVLSGIFTFIVYQLIGKYIIKRKDLKQVNFYLSHLYIANIVIFTLEFNLQQFSKDVFDWIMITLIYLYSMNKNKNNTKAVVFKYLSYISIGITLFAICNLITLTTNIKLLIPSIITVLFLSIEPKVNIKSDKDYIFKTLLQIVSYLCIAFMHGISAVISAIILTVIISIVNYIQENKNAITDKSNSIIHFIGIIMVGLITFSIKKVDPFIIQITYFSIAIGSSMCAMFKYKKELFTITSGIYLLMAVISTQSRYLGVIAFLIWSLYNYFVIFNENNYKDLFKAAIYINLLILYNFILEDLNMNQYATIRLLGYLICSMAIADIVKKWSDGPFKEIAVCLINIYALSNYLNNFDGMFFTLVLIALVIYSYYKKSGNLFMIIIVNIMVNIFALTRKFWFSVPWWVYLLVVGSALIGFAVKNEANENKSISKGIVDNIKSIKEKIDNG